MNDEHEPKLISGTLRIECLRCKATESRPIITTTGTIDLKGVTLAHEDWCDFLKAIEASPATARGWVTKHGYPVRYWLNDQPIPVAHPHGDNWKLTQ
jgi:hypothetical protein